MTPDFTLSPETRLLVETLHKVPLGAEIAYADLTAALGLDVTGPARAALNTARRILERDEGAVFVACRRTGLRRLTPEEAPDIGANGRRKIRRTANRSLRAMQRLAATSNGLDPDAQRRLNAEITASGLLAKITEDKPVRAMQAENPTPPAHAATAFLKAIGAKAG
jgi:hypothetical protein